MKYDDVMTMKCPICKKEIRYNENFRGTVCLNDEVVAVLSTDCHGIPYRTICVNCYEKVMDEKGYDGCYYSSADECIDYEY